MEEFLKIAGLVIAVIAGPMGLFKIILEIRKQYREDRSLSTLLAKRQIRIAIALTLIGFAVLFGLIWLSIRRTETRLIVQLWDVEQGAKHAIVASRQFTKISGHILSNDELQQLGSWLVEQVGQRYDLNAEELQLRVDVTGNLNSERLKVEVTPSGPYQMYFWIVNGGKSRVPFNEQAAFQLGKDFDLEISRPGYESKVIRVKWGRNLRRTFTVQPLPIRIAIEEFERERDSIASQLMDFLTSNSRFSITDPGTLKMLKEEIAKNKALLAESPGLQQGYQTSLGIDLIVSGR